ncbi:hypothetical protein Bca4012_098179 [Brassica carinata]|uniref:(rape) hypothetical protein n=1 Tax=Brassica napus TaxID=3708 RepID=A0A816Q3H3_BRANA|nr:unnamed protein product [Brassica napus]
MKIFLRCFKPKFYKKWLAFFVLCRRSVEVFLLTIVVEMKCSKSATSYMKIRLEIVRKRRIAMIKFLKMDIVEFLKNGLDYDAYRRIKFLKMDFVKFLKNGLDYDAYRRLSMLFWFPFRECPEECREAVSSLIYAAAWVPDVPELKDLIRRFGNFSASSVNHELVDKTELRRRPSRELRIQTVKDIAKEFSIDWDPTALNLLLLRQTFALQIEDKVETGADDPKIERKKSIVNDQSENESVLSQAWTRDSLSNRSLSSTSNSSFGSPRRDTEKKKILPYGIIFSFRHETRSSKR